MQPEAATAEAVATPPPASPPSAPWNAPFPPEATPDDILNCFRLLLGRRPNREEWPGHVLRAGEPLDRVVASYVGSLEFFRRGFTTAGAAEAGVELARLPGFEIYVAAADAAVGRFVRDDNYERDVTAVFRRLLRPGMGVLDLGANIGYFALLSAAVVGPEGLVVAVEPNPDNVRLLEASRRRNGFEQRLRVVQAAGAREPGTLVLHRDFSNGTTSEAPDDPAVLLGSETVGCVRAETLVPRRRRID
ncbi:MAG: FkbM family methyltransferase, partial [Gluconacetobacter diazotrophicus]|nr:FkbM family methyltransferase [Gluconacetobacter diazotrophicus]